MNTTGDSFGGQPRGEGWGGEDALLLAELGDLLDKGLPKAQGVHVPNAAAAPTQAEFNALLTSLRDAGVIASS